MLLMRAPWDAIQQMLDLEPVTHQCVGDQPPMAAPPDRLRAHDRQCFAGARSLLERGQRRAEFGRRHVFGIACERGVAPAGAGDGAGRG